MKIELHTRDNQTGNLAARRKGDGWPFQINGTNLFCYKRGESSNWYPKTVWNQRRVNK